MPRAPRQEPPAGYSVIGWTRTEWSIFTVYRDETGRIDGVAFVGVDEQHPNIPRTWRRRADAVRYCETVYWRMRAVQAESAARSTATRARGRSSSKTATEHASNVSEETSTVWVEDSVPAAVGV